MATVTPPPFLAQRQPAPRLELLDREEIPFLHPGYDAPNVMFTMARVDTTLTTPNSYGVHHRTALLACQIVANNIFDRGRLALDREGKQRVQVPIDGVLTDSKYFFIVDGTDLYSVVPSFQDWQFPHDNVPEFWPESAALSSTNCGVTNTNYAIDGAHLVPQKETTWFQNNDMSMYGNMDSKLNIIPLRKDIHHCFDSRWFVIVPKIVKVETTTTSTRYVTHIISRDGAELWPTMHNTLVETHKISSKFLFARFAWAILFRIQPFVTNGKPRHVIRVHNSEGGVQYKAERCTGDMLSSLYGGGGSLTATPKKRRSGIGSAANDEENLVEESSSEDSDMSMETDSVWDLTDARKWRGRRRRQESSDETVPDTKPYLEPGVEAALREAVFSGMTDQDNKVEN